MNTRSKILERGELQQRLEGHRRNSQKVVLANGCFDILHAGHVRYLQGARREGDVLVVGVNSDSSMSGLKGSGRPILAAGDRAELVAALGVVDYVVVFDEGDVGALLRELRPDVHAKGTDYTPDTVPERHEAARLGVRVAIVGDRKQHSTRGLIRRIRDSGHG